MSEKALNQAVIDETCGPDGEPILFDQLTKDEQLIYCAGLTKRTSMALDQLLASQSGRRGRYLAILRTKAEELSTLADVWLATD